MIEIKLTAHHLFKKCPFHRKSLINIASSDDRLYLLGFRLNANRRIDEDMLLVVRSRGRGNEKKLNYAIFN